MKLDKNKKLAIFITIFTVILLAGVTYTFFSVAVSNANNEKLQTQTATMSLEFDDGDNGVSGSLNLGESIVKKFTIENTGTVDAYGKINWYNLVNTYTTDSLTWTLEKSDTENGTYTTVGSGKVPTSSSTNTTVLKNGLLVPVSTTYYYKLTITLNNLDINQSSDINASMHSKFSLEAGQEPGTDKILNLVAGEPTNTADVITKPAPEGATCTNTLAYDGTVDNNLRYVGANPCNYVTFNGETAGWRIIGIMNNVDDGTGKKETRIKLVRTTSLGDYSWDSSAMEVNSGVGINDWTGADLKNELNGDYLNMSLNTNTTWYNGPYNAQTGIYDYTKGLKASVQSQIGSAKWYLGGIEYANPDLIPSTMYTLERGNKVWGSTSGQTCNDGYCPRATEWTGKVALIYPSDYGYATSGGTTTNRNACIGILSTYPYNSENQWNVYNSDCENNDYLNLLSSYYCLLSPISNNSSKVFSISSGSIVADYPTNTKDVFPAVYLKSEASISGGNGSIENPYVIE